MAAIIDLVADVGESFGSYRMGDDEKLIQVLTSANVACGFHAGDPGVLEATVTACVAQGVAIGAHPGFADLQGFGRRPVAMTPDEVRNDVLYQMGALSAFARAHGTTLSHVTPHGSLGNLAVTDADYARGILDAVAAYDSALPVVTQEGHLAALARERHIPVAITAMADRAYNADGSLVSRKLPGSSIADPDQVVERVRRMVTDGTVVAYDGTVIDLDPATVLLHGDNAEAIDLAIRIRDALKADGVQFAPIADVLAKRHTAHD